MGTKSMPKPLSDTIQKKFAGYKTTGFSLIDSPSGRFYVATIEKRKTKIELYFGLNYAFVKEYLKKKRIQNKQEQIVLIKPKIRIQNPQIQSRQKM